MRFASILGVILNLEVERLLAEPSLALGHWQPVSDRGLRLWAQGWVLWSEVSSWMTHPIQQQMHYLG